MITDPKKLRKVYEERVCIIPGCGRKYYVSKSRRHNRIPVGIRPRNAKTCSTRCSKKYTRMKWIVPKGI